MHNFGSFWPLVIYMLWGELETTSTCQSFTGGKDKGESRRERGDSPTAAATHLQWKTDVGILYCSFSNLLEWGWGGGGVEGKGGRERITPPQQRLIFNGKQMWVYYISLSNHGERGKGKVRGKGGWGGGLLSNCLGGEWDHGIEGRGRGFPHFNIDCSGKTNICMYVYIYIPFLCPRHKMARGHLVFALSIIPSFRRIKVCLLNFSNILAWI